MTDTSRSPDFGPSTQQLDAALTRDALPAGTRLGGYQIIEVLGRGGFGIVYLALDSSLQRQVAIKEYFPAELAMRCEDHQVWVKPGVDVNAYAVGKAAFLNEAKMLARFDHPSLARVHSFWEENRSAYMVMPYYEGRSLAATLAALPRPPDEAWLRAMLMPLLSALGTLHTAQCMHLDISPENIILLGDGLPVLIDFGVANRLATDKTQPLTALLNPAYAPIEQYSESETLPLGAWTDLYALAGVLHFAITGQPPTRATVRAVDDPQRPLAETVHTLSQRYPGLHYSASFLAGIDKALSVKPRDRPRDVTEFQLCLDHALVAPEPSAAAAAPRGKRNEPVFQPSTQGEERFAADPSSRARRPPSQSAPAWIAGLAVLALGSAGAWAWLQMKPLPTIVFSPPADSAPQVAVPSSAAPIAAAPEPVMPATSPPVLAVTPSEPASAVAPAAPVMATAPELAAEPAASSVATAAPATEPQPSTRPARPVTQPVTQTATATEPRTPRAACGTRANFSLVYCMQAQCNKPRFAQHPQCTDLRRRGEID